MTSSQPDRVPNVPCSKNLSLTALPDDSTGFHAVGRLPMSSAPRMPWIDLDGEWDFQLVDDAAQGLGAQWKTAPVPGLWTMHEPADPPQYLNVAMPFQEMPPNVPAKNVVGVYRREFDLDPMDAASVILHVGVAEGYLRVFINDHLAGTNNDSHLAADFDITGWVYPGRNSITLAVTKWSALSYIEDQDQWWQSGLSRSVFIARQPATHVADVKVVADFDPQQARGSLSVDVAVAGLKDATLPDIRSEFVSLERLSATTSPRTPSMPQ